MTKFRMRTFRRRIIPSLALVVAIVAIVASFEASLHAPNQSFGFGVYWPRPTAYPSDNPPNVYLGINYTGPGLRNYTYVITAGSTVLTNEEVLVGHTSAFRALVHAPVPSVLQAEVLVQGIVVYRQNLTVG